MKRLMSFIAIIFLISVNGDELAVDTSSGITKGYIKNGVIKWSDIPYAKPPIGDLRWKAPRKIEKNSNLILPKEGNFCIQRTSMLGGSSQFSVDSISDCPPDKKAIPGISFGTDFFKHSRVLEETSSLEILFFDLFPARIIFGFKIMPVRSIL